MEKKLKINITYADGVHSNEKTEQSATNNINNWLNALVYEFDKEGVTIDLFIDKNYEQHLSFNNISDELDAKALIELQKFRYLVKGYILNPITPDKID